MKNRVILSIFAMIFVVYMVNLTSAEIILSQPSSLYNLGDEFNINAIVSRAVNTNDFFTAKIVCGSDEVELFKTPVSISAGDSTNFSITAKLDRSLISSIGGTCNIEAVYADDKATSQDFQITDKIDVSLTLSNNVLNPSDNVLISGTAKKANGEDVNGFAVISLLGTNLSVLTNVNSGIFNLNLTIPSNNAAGIFQLNVRVYERESSGEETNQGSTYSTLQVRQILKSMNIAPDSYSANPGENLSFTVLVYDQANSLANADVDVAVYLPNNQDIYSRKLIKSSQSYALEVPNNATPGFWNIEASAGSISSQRSFQVNELSEASFTLDNQTIVVDNMGNVPYNKTVEFLVGKDVISQQLNVDVGKIKRYIINAPDGDYNLSLFDGNQTIQFGITHLTGSQGGLFSLTGSAINVRDLESSKTGTNIVLLIWLIVILFLVIAVVYYFGKVRRRHFIGTIPSFEKLKSTNYQSIPMKTPKISEEKIQPKKEKPAVPSRLMFETYNPVSAKSNSYSNLVPSRTGGSREEAIVIALKIKNSQRLNASQSSAHLTVEHSLHKARMAKGRVYDQGDFKLIVFSKTISPDITPVEAIKIAADIDKDMKEFNKKFAIKIEYGIGANIGDMLFEIVDGRPKFTTIGNTIVLAKNAAERAKSEIYVSQPLFRKVYNIVKSEPTQSGLYKIISIIDRSYHSEFINRFMKKKDNNS